MTELLATIGSRPELKESLEIFKKFLTSGDGPSTAPSLGEQTEKYHVNDRYLFGEIETDLRLTPPI